MFKPYVVPKDNSFLAKAEAWVKNRAIDIGYLWTENKDEIVKITPVVVGGVVFLVKTITRHNHLAAEKRLKDLYIYDPKLRRYWELRKKLSAGQALELERRRNAGEDMGKILMSMRVLKY